MKKLNLRFIGITGLIAAVSLVSGVLNAQESKFTITPHKRTHLQTRTEYPVKAYFPIKDKNISNIQLDLLLQCPDRGCSDWDYSINVVLRSFKDGKTTDYQLGRMITPYSGWYNQGDNAPKWDRIWSWNITEYYPLLTDTVEIVMQYEGYQDGFLATTDFIFTENDPKIKKNDKRFIGVEQIYYSYYPFGREDSTIDQFLGTKKVVLPKGTKKVLSRIQISGHGGDTLNAAAEFLEKRFVYVANKKLVANSAVWRDDCGCNPIQPQGGTWIYKRAGWCPGTKVQEEYYDLTPFVEGNELNVEMLFEYYNNQGLGEPGYQIANELFFIGDKDYRHKEIDDKFGAGRDNKQETEEVHYLPNKFNLVFKTNKMADDKYSVLEGTSRGQNGGCCGKDAASNVLSYEKKLYERSQMAPNTKYVQEVDVKDGEYMIRIEDDGCDGFSWWANPDQGEGYALIYNEDMTEVLETFEPDFGCKVEYRFVATSDNSKVKHSKAKLAALNDADNSEYRIIFYNADNEENEMTVKIMNRRSKEDVMEKTFGKKSTFDEVIDYSELDDGYYRAEIKCGDYHEYKYFVKRKQ